jgi:hypothetical protein
MCSLNETVSGRETGSNSAAACPAGSATAEAPGVLDAESHPAKQMTAIDETKERSSMVARYARVRLFLSQVGKSEID